MNASDYDDQEFIERVLNELGTCGAAEREQFVRDRAQARPHLVEKLLRMAHAMEDGNRLLNRDKPADGFCGRRLGHYVLEEMLGKGAFGAVYFAKQVTPPRREVAVKILHPRFSGNFEKRFTQEMQILCGLDHPNIVRILGSERAGGRLLLVMEYINGMRIDFYCRQRKLSLRKCVELFRQLCEAVAHAQHRGIVHCDLKPTHALVKREDNRDRVKLIDFGIARFLYTELSPDPLAAIRGAEGTRGYCSPEQARSESLGFSSDVFSLGVILYQMLTGLLPYPEGADLEEYRGGIETAAPAAPSECTTLFPAGALRGDLDAIVLRAIERDPATRYERARDLAADLQAWLDGHPVEARQGGPVYRGVKFLRRHLLSVGATLLSLLALAGTSTFAYAEWQRAERLHRLSLADRHRLGDKFPVTLAEVQREYSTYLEKLGDQLADKKDLALAKAVFQDARDLAILAGCESCRESIERKLVRMATLVRGFAGGSAGKPNLCGLAATYEGTAATLAASGEPDSARRIRGLAAAARARAVQPCPAE